MTYTYEIWLDAPEIERLMDIRGFKYRADLARAMGYNPRHGNIDRLLGPSYKSRQVNVDLNLLGLLCTALGCRPGDIIHYRRIPIYTEDTEKQAAQSV